jgi:hypothetical protein
MKKIITFLDLLGFSEYCRLDASGAARLLEAQKTTLQTKFSDQEIRYTDLQCQRLASCNAVTSFEYFLPFSDSIFIIASDADLFVQQISTFLVDAFLLHGHTFAHADNPNNPTVQRIKVFSTSGVHETEEQWFPCLWRGGVTFGEVNFANVPIINKGTQAHSPIAFGTGIVDAVGLEKSGKGPRLFCSKEISNIPKMHKHPFVVECIECKGYEILWPCAVFNEKGNPDTEATTFLDLFLPAKTLWVSKIGTLVEQHYWEYLRLIIRSALHWAKTVNALPDVRKIIISKAEENILPNCSSSLLVQRLCKEYGE